MALQVIPQGAQLAERPDARALVDAWLAALAGDYSPATVAAYGKGLRLFLAWLEAEGLPLPSVAAADVVRWREGLRGEFAAQSVNLWLTGVRRFFAWVVEQGAPISNPAASVRGASRRGTSRRHKRDELTGREVLRVLETCGPAEQGRRDRAILALMAYCALRTVEVHRADLADLQTKDNRLVLWIRGKGHEEADDFVVLPAPAEAALSEWLAIRGDRPGPLFHSLSNRTHGERLGLRALRGMVKARYAAAGVVGARKTTHSLRHSAITAALRAGASPLQVQAMARHTSFDTTMTYVHELGRTTAPAEDLITYAG